MTISPRYLLDDYAAVFDLTVEEMLALVSATKSCVEQEENLLQCSQEPILVVGDTHGNFEGTTSIVDMWKKKGCTVVFLGDYIDRGEKPLETINLLLALKLSYPEKVFLLRGNHETLYMNSRYGFLSYCMNNLGKDADTIHKAYNELFSYLPPAFLISREILLIHGGIPSGLTSLEEIKSLPRGDLDGEHRILAQILWNDPSETHQGFQNNSERGFYYTFGKEVFLEFLENHQLKRVIRGHQVFPEGYRYFFDRKLLSIFSSPNYRGSRAKIAAISEEGDIQVLDVIP